MIRDSLESLGGSARWVPHEENPVDCMTKLKGNISRMLQLLKSGTFRLTAESEEMEKRKQYREATGKKNPRPNKTTLFESSTTRVEELLEKALENNGITSESTPTTTTTSRNGFFSAMPVASTPSKPVVICLHDELFGSRSCATFSTSYFSPYRLKGGLMDTMQR